MKKIVIAFLVSVTVFMLTGVVSEAHHYKPGTTIPCDNGFYKNEDISVQQSWDTSHYSVYGTCHIANYIYSHRMVCTSCNAILGYGPTDYCTEIHAVCGEYRKDCLNIYHVIP